MKRITVIKATEKAVMALIVVVFGLLILYGVTLLTGCKKTKTIRTENYPEIDKEVDGDKIEKKVEDVVEITQRHFSLSDREKDGFLKNLIEGASLTRYGMANALTSLANTTKDYDRAVDLERMGGEVIELKRSEWERLAV